MAAIQGKVSYTEFLSAVNAHEVKNVVVGASGTNAEYQNFDMTGGSVNLVQDPTFLDIMNKNGVNLMLDQPNAAV
jgi:hypothetical protein